MKSTSTLSCIFYWYDFILFLRNVRMTFVSRLDLYKSEIYYKNRTKLIYLINTSWKSKKTHSFFDESILILIISES